MGETIMKLKSAAKMISSPTFNSTKFLYKSFLQIILCIAASIVVIIALFIYMILMCRYELIFYNLALIAPIYGIICNIVILGVINKQRIRYKCQIEGFNENIDELLDKQYDNNNVLNIIMSAFSLAFYILMFFFSVLLSRVLLTNNHWRGQASPSGKLIIVPLGERAFVLLTSL